MMKGIYISVFLYFICLISFSQQVPQYTQYIHNYFALNPALAGFNSCLNVKMGYRKQWVGFDGAPETTFATISTELTHRKLKTLRTKHGIGAYIENDDTGPLSRSTIYLAYAYHFPVGRNVTASIGVFGGIMQMGVDATKLNLHDPNDPIIYGTGKAFLVPDFSPGLFLNHDDWFVGYSIRQIFLNKWQKVIGSSNSRNRFHHYVVGGKRFKTDAFNIVPSGLIKFVGFSNPSIDLNLTLEFSKMFDIGISWRNTDAITGMMNLKFLKFFSLGYAFDMTTSNLKVVSSNTHEIILGISACPYDMKSTYFCPVFQ